MTILTPKVLAKVVTELDEGEEKVVSFKVKVVSQRVYATMADEAPRSGDAFLFRDTPTRGSASALRENYDMSVG